jgi:ribosome recycling factor
MQIIDNAKEKMAKAIDSFNHNLAQIRTGRANPNMLDKIVVEYYGTPTPLNQLAAISVPEGRQLLVKPYDKGVLDDIERAINEANLGIHPQNDGENIRLNIPPLTEESRKELAKDIYKYAEEAKIATRNARRDANDAIKRASDLTEDDVKGYQADIQELTDENVKLIEQIAKDKEAEVLSV